MPTEIERKFLIDHAKWEKVIKPNGKLYKQGYILSEEKRTVRIRVTDTVAYITLKGASTGISRSEYEYTIPVIEGNEILQNFATSYIEKIRYDINYAGHLWEVDVFRGVNNGLIVAEIELNSEDEQFEKPDWVGEEVSHDGRYTNASLSVNPYKVWA
ncbi:MULTISPECIES: CYTH domain-containing protein [unclassified Mucilaginibacter]|uniref:CYTH domain-containing protein n=1 Tax=unclassified Mucilaginibacter TaxID=2617802 RepID=UPI002AC89516|nr:MULTISPECIES: CYTH domain-containing protein [unclassified Mucilaginibacter]MEB0263591.1 CYTH domain-containing protein [Mucilaginibacter sp. 10I4]MEB0280753.1 CYTH domain-containing protein [Mucilaginibacter sp. 10B2]MEB0301470.1 CYTH domain-containing protein [Mucilaginibacter sp. 5C4]WPX22658.1 CYTH domain-containing protein [Mucilaginibacter sp. 5C4]